MALQKTSHSVRCLRSVYKLLVRSLSTRRSRGLFSSKSDRVLMLVSIYNLCDIVNCTPSHQTKAQGNNFRINCSCSACAGDMASFPHSMQMVKAQRKRQRNASSESRAGRYACAGCPISSVNHTTTLLREYSMKSFRSHDTWFGCMYCYSISIKTNISAVYPETTNRFSSDESSYDWNSDISIFGAITYRMNQLSIHILEKTIKY
ncbi:uncharacterized protein LOC122244860, partial [Penaeus japonicus]|uniref:uncharacterized protein LOC122244860 n=1 Tax=Penaeus japonicus TaxID=27405 RepID=UPI001C712548